MKTQNLNHVMIEAAFPKKSVPMENNSSPAYGVDVYFRDLADRLVEHIQQADMVLGCVAWLTHPKILKALAKVPCGVSFVVQKEDFLRPGAVSKKDLRKLYDAIPTILSRYDFMSSDPNVEDLLVGRLSTMGNTNHVKEYPNDNPVVNEAVAIQPIRCAGFHGGDSFSYSSPRMHNKFAIFVNKGDDEKETMTIQSVWTGSFNFTYNATQSLENAVIIHGGKLGVNDGVLQAYFHEWMQILAISEPLDWVRPWVCPQWRIGN